MNDLKLLKSGVWIFTCNMKPLQFDKFVYNDSFRTMEGSMHSISNCGCKIISEEYAKWFIDNKLWSLFDKYKYDNMWKMYEAEVKELAESIGLKYEGV